MKRSILLCTLLLHLCGCTASDSGIDQGLELRRKLLQQGCSFEAEITASYADAIHTFTLQCTADAEGNLTFSVVKPESIQGISGTLSGKGGALTFEDTVLAFPMLAEGEVSPVSSPWLLIHTLRSGYIHSCGEDGGELRLTIYDSYEEDALQLDIWLDSEGVPKYSQILWQGRSILSIQISSFLFL